MNYLRKTATLVDAAKQMLEDAGFGDHESFFARRVKDGVLNLANQFQQENYSTVVGRLVVALFSRVARGSPPTPDFLKEVWREIEAFAKDEPYNEKEERGHWIQKRYPMLNWVGDLHKHISDEVLQRPKAQTFSGAPLVRDDQEPAPVLVDDEVSKPSRQVRVSELRAMAKDGKVIAAIKLYRDATGKGLKESKDFVLALRDEPTELVDDRLPPLDHYGFGAPVVPFVKLDSYGSESMALAPGKASGTIGAKNVTVDLAAKKEIEGKMDAKSKIVGVIREFCRNMESFTSLDVSNKAKSEGLVARHREVAELVRGAHADGVMDTYGYVRDLIDVTLPGGGSAQAYLYRHTTVPADDYRNRAQVALKPQLQSAPQAYDDDGLPPLPTPIIPQNLVNLPQPPTFAAPPAPPTVGRLTRVLNTSSVTRTQKGDGRLEVPHVWLARLGWQVGDTVSAVVDGNGLVLKTTVQLGEQVVRQFTVDRWNRIRITTKALSEVGIHFGTGGQHIMTLRTGDIRID